MWTNENRARYDRSKLRYPSEWRGAFRTAWRLMSASRRWRKLAGYGQPEIFNTDQGSQFTSPRFTGVLEAHGIKISMDGRGRWMDNVLIERLWRSLKYACIYLHALETGSELRAGVSTWVSHYNGHRPHSTLCGRTPDEVYHACPLPALVPGHAPAPEPAADTRKAA